MLIYIFRRLTVLVPLLLLISILIFIVIQLPPGDFLDIYIYKLKQSGIELSADVKKGLERQYGLDRPYYYQYYRWISNIILKGDFGYSFGWNQPVNVILKDRILVTLVISIASILLVWLQRILRLVYSVSWSIGLWSGQRESHPHFQFGKLT